MKSIMAVVGGFVGGVMVALLGAPGWGAAATAFLATLIIFAWGDVE